MASWEGKRGEEVASIEISNGFWMGRRWEADREKIAEQSSCQNFLTQVILIFILQTYKYSIILTDKDIDMVDQLIVTC